MIALFVLTVPTVACDRPASPEGLCDHLANIATTADKFKLDKRIDDRATCVTEFQEIRAEMGDEAFQKLGACVLSKDKLKTAYRDCTPKAR